LNITAIFVVGAPGVGKTTLVRQLLDGVALIEKPKWTVGRKVVAAGHYKGDTFDGADMVPYNGAQDALIYWRDSLRDRPFVIFDGDRFSNQTTLDFLRGQDLIGRFYCVHLVAREDILAARRAKRGSNQNPSWMLGRATKAARFFERTDWTGRMEFDASVAPEANASLLKAWADMR
jgi:GTPase SAR1 family protein